MLSLMFDGFIRDIKESFKKLHWYDWIMIILMIGIASQQVVQAFINPIASKNPLWLTIVNFISAICGVVCVFFCAQASISNFSFGIINTFVYAVYLLYWKIYGTFALEVLFYLPIDVAMWIAWCKNRDYIDKEKCLTRKLTFIQSVIVYTLVVISGITYHSVLIRLGGTVPWLDAFTVAIGIIAVLLQLFRFKEQYVLWIIVDIVSVGMYIVHFDPVYLTKRVIYTIVAVIGLYNWHMLNKNRNLMNK